jgi:hypothetical protein
MNAKTLIWKQQNTHRTRKNSQVWLNKKIIPHSRKMRSVTTVVTNQNKQQKTILWWVPNTQQSLATVTPGWSDTGSEDLRQFHHWNQLYAFPTWLGWCQTLDIRWMGYFLQKEGQRSHHSGPFHGYEFLFLQSWYRKKTEPAYDLFLGPFPPKSLKCSRFSNKLNQSNDVNHFASYDHHQVCIKICKSGLS